MIRLTEDDPQTVAQSRADDGAAVGPVGPPGRRLDGRQPDHAATAWSCGASVPSCRHDFDQCLETSRPLIEESRHELVVCFPTGRSISMPT